MSDPFDLERFVAAQAPIYARVLGELRDGRKRNHWMWFIFPQIAGLGMSAMSERYAIGSLDEARAFLAHPVLGARLRECVGTLMTHKDRTAHAIFGSPDDAKLRSCLTLFAAASSGDPFFGEALERFFGGKRDPRTLERL